MLTDLANDIKVTQSIAPAAQTGTVNGSAVQITDYISATVVFNIGALGGGAASFKVQESPDGTTNWVDIANSRLIGTLAAAVANTTQKVGINDLGSLTLPFIRPVITVVGGTGVFASASVIQGDAKISPVGSSGSVYIA